MSDWRKVLANVAPSLTMLLPPPFNVLGAVAVKTALGLSGEASDDEMTQAALSASPDMILKLKEADQQYALQLKTLELDTEKLRVENQTAEDKIDADDRASARSRETANPTDKTTRNLAYFIIGGGMAVLAAVLSGITKVEAALAGTVIGYVMSEMRLVTTYYFGSSLGSDKKTDLLASYASPSG